MSSARSFLQFRFAVIQPIAGVLVAGIQSIAVTVVAVAIIGLAAAPTAAWTQQVGSVRPTEGLRDNPTSITMLRNATVVRNPDQIESAVVADVLINDSSIVAVGVDLKPPPGCEIINCKGWMVYPGLIDACHESEVVSPDSDYWNGNVIPARNADAIESIKDADSMRKQGITAASIVPSGRIIRGTSSVWLLSENAGAKSDPGSLIGSGDAVGRSAANPLQHVALTVSRGDNGGESYPRSPMGATALLRQAMYDAIWYRDAIAAQNSNSKLPRPENSAALDSLAKQIESATFVFDCPNERMALRAGAIIREFNLNAMLRGSGREYRELDAIKELNRKFLLCLDFPDKPSVASTSAAREVSLQELLHWYFAPKNPAILDDAGIEFCLTTDRLDKVDDFLKNVRIAVDRGLSRKTALAALTTTPASMLGVETKLGKIEPGMLANLVITNGDLFAKDTKILQTWVAGDPFKIDPLLDRPSSPLTGKWEIPATAELAAATVSISLDGGKVSAKLGFDPVTSDTDEKKAVENKQSDDQEVSADQEESAMEEQSADNKDSDDKSDAESKPVTVPISSLVARQNMIDGVVIIKPKTFKARSGTAAKNWPVGASRLSISIEALDDENQSDDPRAATARIVIVDSAGNQRVIIANRVAKKQKSNEANAKDAEEQNAQTEQKSETADPAADQDDGDDADKQPEDGADGDDEDPADEDPADEDPADEAAEDSDSPAESTTDAEPEVAAIPLLRPLGVYGRTEPAPQLAVVLFQNALVWSCADQTDLTPPTEPMDVLVRDGVIAEIAQSISVPEDALVVDCAGRHLTPGIIDCHTHIATDGGVNESGQSVTAEVRIGDFIDNTDIDLYRQLAGGVTAASILHGSANPIGGQNQVIKFRWGDTMEDLRFVSAPRGIKFALGENVKRNGSRYPNTRMGVEQLIRDQFLAAREYAVAHERWASGKRDTLPPRVDLQLQAIAEIQSGKRWVHCHSYRQDEIVATLDVLEEFGVQIGTLQHILEGYKVADRIAAHGAMASSFADWWAYKFEVYDAIPYNGVLMHNNAVVVSYNSDDAELGRHLNTEAAKAVKYGGVSPTEALKFVTLNPAKQLRIADRVGSIEVGKDADLVVWSGPPLSTTTRCEQTWVDGRQMFDLNSDREMRDRDETLRQRLIQMVLAGIDESDSNSDAPDAKQSSKIAEEDRWLRYDEYCNARGRALSNRTLADQTRSDQNQSQQAVSSRNRQQEENE